MEQDFYRDTNQDRRGHKISRNKQSFLRLQKLGSYKSTQIVDLQQAALFGAYCDLHPKR